MDISEHRHYKIIFTDDAIIEMEHIYNYISNNLHAINAAKRLMIKVEKYTKILEKMPRAHKIIKSYPELELEYRRIIINNYVIIYTIIENSKLVFIVHMYYGRSDYLSKL